MGCWRGCGESFERERTFSANLAHEMRTPLAELRAITEIALKWPEDRASCLGTLGEIRGIGLQMETVVVNLLALARYDGGQQAVQTSRVSPREVAAACWHTVELEAEAKGIPLTLEIPADLTLVTDREKLGLILSNLFSNAVAHGTPGRPVTCSAAVTGGVFTLRAANSTSELTEADLPRIFDRFWRKDAARSEGRHAGLGLSLVSALCELLGFYPGGAPPRRPLRNHSAKGDVMKLSRILPLASLAASLLAAAASAQAPKTSPPAAAAKAAPKAAPYHVVKEIPLGGEGGWDYLPSTRRAGGSTSRTRPRSR